MKEYECEINDECSYWDETENTCLNDDVYINPETGESCCKYLDGAISEDDYKDWYSNYEDELWDDIN
jgi:hypothetical protein